MEPEFEYREYDGILIRKNPDQNPAYEMFDGRRWVPFRDIARATFQASEISEHHAQLLFRDTARMKGVAISEAEALRQLRREA